MTDLIYLEIPVLIILPVLAVVFSVITSILSKIHILQWICAAVHGVLIAAVIYLGGGLSDIFVMLMLSLIASCICEMLKSQKGGSKK